MGELIDCGQLRMVFEAISAVVLLHDSLHARLTQMNLSSPEAVALETKMATLRFDVLDKVRAARWGGGLRI